MRSLLKRALEDYTPPEPIPVEGEDRTIVMRGPLADIYTQALNVAYAKEDPQANDIQEPTATLESQQMDAHVLQKLSAAISHDNVPPTDNFDTVYGVSRNEMTEQTVVDVTTELAGKGSGPSTPDFYLIIDAMNLGEGGGAPGESTEKIEQIGQALECLVSAHGGKVFHSLQEFAASRS